ncbi:MAG: hypothetical protein HY914_09430 [Desulfomonile tiedjei]|nr:hypothetical protein [Desulfomonile tiedjei]
MHIGILFHKNPFLPPTGIDLVRLRALASGLIRRGIKAEIVSPVDRAGLIDGNVPVKPLAVLNDPSPYAVLKTCYHDSIELIGSYQGPVVSRIVRVVDDRLPERDEPARARLLRCQERIRERASVLVLNNRENMLRWRELYGPEPRIVLVPTGCPQDIPPRLRNPFHGDRPVALFLGSVAAPRMVRMLNEAARRLGGVAEVHLVGLNKACLYGGDENCRLDSDIVDHGEVIEEDAWDYIRYAAVGIALATGPLPFDNDVSKILTYLRGGLPVLSEEPILNNALVRQTGLGTTFAYDDAAELAAKVKFLIRNPMREKREQVMRFMAEEHSWDRRVDTYVELFNELAQVY